MDNRFQTSIIVRIGDINYAGHMGNDRFLTLFQDARIQFLDSLGCSETDIGDGIGLVMSEAHVRYLKEVFLGDELVVELDVRDRSKSTFTVHYAVRRGVDEVASGYTAIVCFDYKTKKIARMPDGFCQRLTGGKTQG